MKRLVLAVCLLAVALPAVAQQEFRAGQKARDGQPWDIRLGSAAIIRSDVSIARVVIGNPIIEANPQTDRVLSINAVKAGFTNLFLLDEAGNTIYSTEIVVSAPSHGRGAIAVHAPTKDPHSILPHHTYRCSPVCSYVGTVPVTRLSPATGEELPDQTIYNIVAPSGPSQPAPAAPPPPRR